jgi:beta-N-acetylhexosaminidase
MLDIQGLSLSIEEREQLANPLVGGLILFGRNFKNIEQLMLLIQAIRAITGPQFIIAVDHEGGRVQRFKQDFTHIPSMAQILAYAKGDLAQATGLAVELGWLMASELLSIDIDISFAPVLDVDGCSSVIGDRAFSSDPMEVISIGQAFIDGMAQAGMKCTGKHFPGHGSVAADSHIAIPVDDRTKAAIESLDMSVFKQLISQDKINALMPAHVIYPAFDDKPAGFSSFWIQTVLREQLDFDGVIFSDDLGMEGATVAGNFSQRTEAALTAGCDMVLVCNKPQGTVEVLSYLEQQFSDVVSLSEREKSALRLNNMLPTTSLPRAELRASERWHNAVAIANKVR